MSVRDGTRAPGDLEDRAAHHDRGAHRLTINADFRGYTSEIRDWLRLYPNIRGARGPIEMACREWFEQQLSDAIYGALALAGPPHWDDEAIAIALHPCALTSVVNAKTPRLEHMKKELHQILGKPRADRDASDGTSAADDPGDNAHEEWTDGSDTEARGLAEQDQRADAEPAAY